MTKRKKFYFRAIKFLRTYGINIFFARTFLFIKENIEQIIYSFCKNKMNISMIPQKSYRQPIILLASVRWEFRKQRPQQLSLSFQKLGSTVLYCNFETYKVTSPGWRIEKIQKGIYKLFFFAKQKSSIKNQVSDKKSLFTIKFELQELINKISKIQSKRPLVIIENPYWGEVIDGIKGADIVYDCLDEFSDFEDSDSSTKYFEKKLIQNVDGIVSTAQYLDNKWLSTGKPHCIIRNAVDFDHFSNKPAFCYQSPSSRPILGYHGAIEQWFDVDLIKNLASTLPDCTIVLVGGISNPEVKKQFSSYNNIELIGEVEYSRLPFYLYSFDIGLVPFLIQPLTLNTNPVKVYEYLAAGIPVVSVPLPEMLYFNDLVTIADRKDFAATIRSLLNKTHDKIKMKEFASNQTWMHRVLEFYNFQQLLHNKKNAI